jgi:hypothetical protein
MMIVPRKRLCRTLAALTKKHTAIVWCATETTAHGTYWDGGSRQDYFRVNLTTGKASAVTGLATAPPPFCPDGHRVKLSIEPGTALCVGGHFCGKIAHLQVYLHPLDVCRALSIDDVAPDMPLPIMADYLMDRGRTEDEQIVRDLARC